MKMVAGAEHRIGSWGDILRVQRIKSGLSCHQVASHIGVEKEIVRDWEKGELSPGALQLKRLYDLLPRLRYFNEFLPRFIKDKLLSRAYAAGEEGKQLWVPPSPTPEDLPVPEDIARTTFGDSLRVALRDEGLVEKDILDLVNAPNETTVLLWESNSNFPNAMQYEALLELLPQLQLAPRPGEADTTPPPVIPTEGKVLRLVPAVADAPGPLVKRLVDPLPVVSKSPAQALALPKPIPAPPPVPIPAPAPPEPKPQRRPKKTQVEASGVRFANARVALEQALTYLEDLKNEVPKVEAEIVRLKKSVEEAEQALMDAVREASTDGL